MSIRSKKLKDLIAVSSLLLVLFQVLKLSRGVQRHVYDPVIASSSVMYDKNMVKYIPYQSNLLSYDKIVTRGGFKWSEYAYVQYATDWDYLCGCVINFIDLRKKLTKADLVLLITDDLVFDKSSQQTRLFEENVVQNDIKIHKVEPLRFKSDSTTWDKSFTKFHVFKLTQYKRVIYFDSDSRVLKNMDELFFLPESKIAMPAAYDSVSEFYKQRDYNVPDSFKFKSPPIYDIQYESYQETADMLLSLYTNSPELVITEGFEFENQIMVIRPSMEEYNKLIKLTKSKKSNEYDMDIINKLYNVDRITKSQIPLEHENLNIIPDVLVISHLKYGFLTGEFRKNNHDVIFSEPQDLPFVVSQKLAKAQRSEAYWHNYQTEALDGIVSLAHFSDYPVPKPWYSDELPNGFAQFKILWENDTNRMEKYNEYNSKQDDEKDYILPKLVKDAYLAEQWNQFYEKYIEDRRNNCALEPI